MSKAKKPTTKKPAKTGEQLRKEALAVTGANIARIEASERGANGNGPTDFFPKRRSGGGKKSTAAKAVAKATPTKVAKAKRLGALDAAAQVLAASKQPMNSQNMIKAMAERKLWTSPGGKTPHATLYAALIREIATKGKASRFKKMDRGMFTAAGKAESR